MNIDEIINSIPYLTKGQLYKLHSEATVALKHVEEAERKHRESVRQRQREIVDQMNKCLREFHTLSASLRAINADDRMENYTDCFVDQDYESPVFGFIIDRDNDISVSTNPYGDIAEWYREEKKGQTERKKEKEG